MVVEEDVELGEEEVPYLGRQAGRQAVKQSKARQKKLKEKNVEK